jgi:acyl-coenzyme A thioesterase PaaI-like protein
VTDLATLGTPLPSRLGVRARFEDDQLVLELTPQPETSRHGIIRASVLAFVIDVAAGMPLDRDAETWMLTSDMTVRMRPVAPPRRIDAVGEILRQGRRSATCVVHLTTDEGAPFATGAMGFSRVSRKASDPPKPLIPLEQTPQMFQGQPTLTRPLRAEAGVQVIDVSEGIVQVELTTDVRNAAGTLQGAMVALVAEAAVEEIMESRFGVPFVVTNLDLRYLRQTQGGPVRTRCRLLGDRPDSSVQVELVDLSNGDITTLVFATAAAVP